jgi:hypothetical protein
MSDTAPHVWGVRPALPAALAGLAVAFLIWLLFAGTPGDRLVAGAGVFLAAISAALLTTMRRRLTADSAGFAVRGPAGVRQVRWDRVVAIAAPTRRRRGIASTSLELDLDDDGLIVLGRTELGADPSDVAQELRTLWLGTR